MVGEVRIAVTFGDVEGLEEGLWGVEGDTNSICFLI